MIPQFDNQILTSFALLLDNKIQSNGRAFTNFSGLLYQTPSSYQGLTAYSTPFRSLCNDTSVVGANIMTGVYFNGNFITVGQSGLVKINHDLGTAYFSGNVPSTTVISGRYAVKDFNIAITDELEYKLFETKYVFNPKYNQTLSGLASDIKIAPIIYIRPKDLENKPFAFGRIDENTIDIRTIVIADNQFNKTAVCNILKNLNMTVLPLVSSTPFDYMGNYTGLNYNYSGTSSDTTYYPTIWSAKVIGIGRNNTAETENLSRNSAIVDFSIRTIMRHP